MSYTSTLKSFRKELSQRATTPVKIIEPSRSGFMSSPARQAVEAPKRAETKYDPKDFVLRQMQDLVSVREEATRSLNDAASQAQSKSNKAIGSLGRSVASTLKKEPEKEVVREPVQPTRANTERTKDDDMTPTASKPGSKDILKDAPFLNKVKDIASKYGTSPAAILATMHFETGGSFSTGVKNAAGSGATGLIQFMPSTAKSLGTTTEALAKMDRIKQLEYVDKYFAQTPLRKNQENTVEDVYMSVLWPKAVGKPSDYVLFEKGTKAYEQNKGLDTTGKGYVTKADAAGKVKQYLGAYSDV